MEEAGPLAAHPVTTAGRPSKAETDPPAKGQVRIPGSPSFPVSVYDLGSSGGNTTGGSKNPNAPPTHRCSAELVFETIQL